jgi:hypothetical protein
MLQPVACARVRWRTAAEGGRSQPPAGPVYASVGRFADGQECFSVVLRFPEAAAQGGCGPHDCELTLLAPDRLPDIASQFAPGRRLDVLEGARIVAECELLSVRTEDRSQQAVFSSPAPSSPSGKQ